MSGEHPYPAVEFEADLTAGGTLNVPPEIARRIGAGRVTVRLTPGGIGVGLRGRRVTEEEIERIVVTQFEQRDHVIEFLRSEGGLARSEKFSERARKLLGTRR